MLFDAISSTENVHSKCSVAQSDSDLSLLDDNTSFTLTFNKNALITQWKFRELNKIADKILYIFVCFMENCPQPRSALTSNTEMYRLRLIN